jgi:WD40 repeat protein
LYDGKTGEKVDEFPAAHKGGVYSVAWSPDSKMLLSVSADKTAIFWDVADRKPITTITFGTDAEQMQTGCAWVNNTPMCLSLDGTITYLSPESSEPVKVICGHNKSITALTVDNGSIITASFDARMLRWNLDGTNERFTGEGHSNQISQVTVLGDYLVTAGMDDTVRVAHKSKCEFINSYATDGPVFDVDAVKTGKVAAAVTRGTVSLFDTTQLVNKASLSFEALCCAISVDEQIIAVGGKDKKLHLFNNDLKETGVLDCLGEVTCVRFSPNGQFVATADSSRNIFVWDVATKKKLVEGWQYHNAKVNSLAWNADNNRLASGSLDGFVYVWNVSNPTVRLSMMNANVVGVNVVAWIDDCTVATAGQDCALKTWKLK